MTIRRSRPDGITELAPKLAPLESGDRLIVIVTVVLVTGGLFLCGLVPALVVVAVVASCAAGEIVLGVKALALAMLRPRAPVHEVPSFARRRGA